MSLAPGWYRDPADPTTQRWWDGEGWVGDPLPADATPPTGPPPVAGGDQPAPAPSVPTPFSRPSPPATAPPPSTAGPTPGSPPAGPYRRATRYGVPAPQRPHGHLLAPLSARLLARLFDIGAVLALNVLVNGWFVHRFWTEISPVMSEAWRRSLTGESVDDLPTAGDQAGNLLLVILLLAAALWFAYEVPYVANTGQTPGKRLLRIKVVRLEDAAPLGFGRSFRRWNPMGLPVLLWWCGIGPLLQLLDIMFALVDRQLQQAWHDRSAHTAVILLEPAPDDARDKEPSDASTHPS